MAAPPARLRVATYNTRDFLDDHRLAARLVRAVDPDVLCLQEVPRRVGGVLRVRRFAARCGLRAVGRHIGSGGTTVLVSPRVELVAADHRRLPVRWPDRTRGFARATVRLPGGARVTAVSVHLGLRAAERVEHAAAVLAALAGAGPLVVAGDLNEDVDGAAARVLLERGGLVLAGPDGPTYPAASPRRRLDVLLTSPGLRPLPAAEVAVPDAAWSRASDHRAAWVDLEVG